MLVFIKVVDKVSVHCGQEFVGLIFPVSFFLILVPVIGIQLFNPFQPSSVSSLPYPLHLSAVHRINYFRPRDEWRLTDMLANPMVLMMVVPLILLVVLPKLVNANDPEVKKVNH